MISSICEVKVRRGGTRIPAAHLGICWPADVVVPNGPGLGVEIDACVIEKSPFIPGSWSFFKIDSPPETVAVTGDHNVK